MNIPPHRRKRDRFAKAQLAPVKFVARRPCECVHKWAGHEPRGDGDRGYCLTPNCGCLAYREAS